jgi:hypothetical protein
MIAIALAQLLRGVRVLQDRIEIEETRSERGAMSGRMRGSVERCNGFCVAK